jgi:hypothetical protein
MRKLILSAFLFIALLCASSPSYALDFVKFGTSHDDDFWGSKDNDLTPFPSTLDFLSVKGKHEITSLDLIDGNVQNVFDGDFGAFDAIVVSESIDEKLSPESYALFNEYVSAGGCLILTGDHGEGEAEFLNNTFGYTVQVLDTTDKVDTFSIQPGAIGTAFAAGPGNLTAADLTTAFGNTPGKEIYTGALGVVVFTDEFGEGTVNVIGWDYCCLDDPGSNTRDQILDWYEVVNRAFEQCQPTPPPTIPTLSEWGLIAMAGVLGIFGLLAARRRRAAA